MNQALQDECFAMHRWLKINFDRCRRAGGESHLFSALGLRVQY
jgi:hypothetical protein